MPQEGSQQAPAAVRKWVTYVVAFSVSVAIGLAPLLGKLRVPLFSPMLDMIPTYFQDSLITLTSALMGLVAVVVQWFSETGLSQTARRQLLKICLPIAFISAISFYVVSTFVVETVEFGGKNSAQTASFLIGFNRPIEDPCTKGVSNARCIELLSFDRALIAGFWGDSHIRIARIALITPYIVFMITFGGLIGAVMHRRA